MNPGIKSRSFWKISRIQEILSEIKRQGYIVPFIAIVESWLKPHISDAQLSIEDYQVFRADRIKSKNGGSLLYIYKSIPIDDYGSFDDNTCNGLICLSRRYQCFMVSLYRPPNSDSKSFCDVLEFLNKFVLKHNAGEEYQCLIFGDFNFPWIRWDGQIKCSDKTSSNSFSDLKYFMDKHFLNQYILKNTRLQNILDLFLTNEPHFVKLVKVEKLPISDHNLIKIYTNYFWNLAKTQTTYEAEENNGTDFMKLNFNTSNTTKIQQEFSAVDWDAIVEGSIDSFPDKFNTIVFNTLCKHTLFKKSPKKRLSSKAIYILNRKIRKLKRRLLYLTDKTKLEIKLQNKIIFLQEKKKEQLHLEKLKKEHNALEKIKKDSKYFFAYAKRNRKTKDSPHLLLGPDDELITNPKDIADMFQNKFKEVFSCPLNENEIPNVPNTNTAGKDYHLSDIEITKLDFIQAINSMKGSSSGPKFDIPAFIFKQYKEYLSIPLTKFWNKSYEKGKIPLKYKTQIITPIHKKGNKTDADNWRQIAITPNPIKICERVFRKKITEYLEENQILNTSQHGFRQNRSCSTQLIAYINHIFSSSINGQELDCIYLDYSKAFDRVDHGILLKKLLAINITGKVYKWLESFLKERTQTVIIQNCKSFTTPVVSGVPQGSVLAPVLFAISTNDIHNCVDGGNILTFADDTKVFSTINSTTDMNNLQQNLNQIYEWSKTNNMILNENKFEMMNFNLNTRNKSKKLLQELPFEIPISYQLPDTTYIEPTNSVRDLGIIIDSELSWDVHRNLICKKARRMCAWVLNTFHTREKEPMKILFTSLVRPLVEYCSEVWLPYKKKDIIEIEQIQRSYTAKISGMTQLNYYERLKALKLPSLQRRREEAILIIIWKMKNNVYPNSVNFIFKLHTRTGTERAIIPPLPRTSLKLQSKYDECFIVRGAKLWNSLPAPLTRINDLSSFRSKLKKHLSQMLDNPPIPGYSSTTTNSLVDL